MSDIKFIAYPEATIYKAPNRSGGVVKKVLWGDYAEVDYDPGQAFQKVIKCRGETGWIHKKDLQDDRILEVNFIDVGQGDGCFIVTPEDKFILIDAGMGDEMYRFLSWRFNLLNNKFQVPIDYLIISHPDSDHYNGFRKIINSPRFKIYTIYHNGIVDRKENDELGSWKMLNNEEYLTDIIDTTDKMSVLVSDKTKRGGKPYPNMMYQALKKKDPVNNIEMLSKGSVIPGYGTNDKISMDVLGPVCLQNNQTNNQKWLRYFDKDDGETKNGHSVIIMLRYNKVKIFVGGDLNDKSQEHLAIYYTKMDPHTTDELERQDMIEEGRKVFACDVAKSCHHGSHKFLDDFLSFLHPAATVISSGDNETYTHPRPETIGAIGKRSRGNRPLIFSTELARSSVDKIRLKEQDIARLYELNTQCNKETDPVKKKALEIERNNLKAGMERNVAVYGTINVRTDGEKVLIAHKKEQKGAGFIIFKLEPDNDGVLEYVP